MNLDTSFVAEKGPAEARLEYNRRRQLMGSVGGGAGALAGGYLFLCGLIEVNLLVILGLLMLFVSFAVFMTSVFELSDTRTQLRNWMSTQASARQAQLRTTQFPLERPDVQLMLQQLLPQSTSVTVRVGGPASGWVMLPSATLVHQLGREYTIEYGSVVVITRDGVIGELPATIFAV